MTARWVAALAFVAVVTLAACARDPAVGYSTRSVFPRGYETVSVAIFESESFVREVEFELADALVKEIEARSPYKVSHHTRSDTQLTGRISDIRYEQLSKSPVTGLAEEFIVELTVDFEWRDVRSGEVLVARRDFSTHGLALTSSPNAEPIEYGQFAAVEQMARDIVDEMRSAW